MLPFPVSPHPVPSAGDTGSIALPDVHGLDSPRCVPQSLPIHEGRREPGRLPALGVATGPHHLAMALEGQGTGRSRPLKAPASAALGITGLCSWNTRNAAGGAELGDSHLG